MRLLFLLIATCISARSLGYSVEENKNILNKKNKLNNIVDRTVVNKKDSSIKDEVGHAPLTGTIIGGQLRCQGYLCPSWALDISRYDTIQYVNETFEYNLQEPLPLAPTFQR